MQVADDNEVIASSAKLMQRNKHVYEVLANGVEAMDRNTFDSNLHELIEAAKKHIPNHVLPDLPCTPELPGVPAWYEDELAIWNQGEAIRQLVCTARKKLNNTQVMEILDICQNQNARRGRESFVMLLGQRAYAAYAPQIAALLGDRDVGGHCIYTLYKMGAAGYSAEIAPFLADERTWVRDYAKRYMQRYGEPQ